MTTESAVEETDSLHTNEAKHIPESQLEGVPIDKGWAWVVLAGKFLTPSLCVLYQNPVMCAHIISSSGC